MTPATTPADGLKAADALEAEYLAVANGKKNPGQMDLEPLVRAVQTLRALATPSPGKAEAEDAARYRFIMNSAYKNLLPSGEALDAIMKPFAAMERDNQG